MSGSAMKQTHNINSCQSGKVGAGAITSLGCKRRTRQATQDRSPLELRGKQLITQSHQKMLELRQAHSLAWHPFVVNLFVLWEMHAVSSLYRYPMACMWLRVGLSQTMMQMARQGFQLSADVSTSGIVTNRFVW